MSEVSVTWIEQKRFIGVDSTDHGIVLSVPGDEGTIGAKPSDLLLLALGSCASADVVGILQKKRQPLTGLQVKITAQQQADPPWTFQKFHLHYIVRGHGLSCKAVEDAIALADEKYCSVAATLRQSTPLTFDYEIVEEALCS